MKNKKRGKEIYLPSFTSLLFFDGNFRTEPIRTSREDPIIYFPGFQTYNPSRYFHILPDCFLLPVDSNAINREPAVRFLDNFQLSYFFPLYNFTFIPLRQKKQKYPYSICLFFFFFRFSYSDKRFIFNYSYFQVSALRVCKFLYIKQKRLNFVLLKPKLVFGLRLINFTKTKMYERYQSNEQG